VHYSFLLREADGRMHIEYERHVSGVFPEATWVQLLTAQGFDVTAVTETSAVDRSPRRFFLGRKPGESGAVDDWHG
jgi:hypothetical protein